MTAKALNQQEAMNVAAALRDNGLIRGKADFLNGGSVMVPVAIRKDVTPAELADALKETQPDLPCETLLAISSSPVRFADGRVYLEFTFELATTALNFQHALNDIRASGALRQLALSHRQDRM